MNTFVMLSTMEDHKIPRTVLIQFSTLDIIAYIKSLSENERMDLFGAIFGEFCLQCGDNNPKCQCWNDE